MNTPPRTPESTLPPAGPAPATRPARRRRALSAGLGAASAATLLSLSAVLAAPAHAHDQLLSTTPEAGATVTTTPDELSLTFSDDLITGQGIQNLVTVTGEAGHQWQDGEAQVAGPALTAALCEGMPKGDYDIAYRVVYSDGHSEAKQYSFTLDDPSAPQTGAPEDCGVPNPDAPVSSGQTPTSAGAGTAGAGSGGEQDPPTLDTPAPLASDQGGEPAQPEAASAADPAGVPTWVWVVGVLGVLIVAAAMVLVFRRAQAIDHPAGDHPGSEG